MCRIENQTHKCLIFGARPGPAPGRSELKNARTAFFNKLPEDRDSVDEYSPVGSCRGAGLNGRLRQGNDSGLPEPASHASDANRATLEVGHFLV
jgi:hypothetical protein